MMMMTTMESLKTLMGEYRNRKHTYYWHVSKVEKDIFNDEEYWMVYTNDPMSSCHGAEEAYKADTLLGAIAMVEQIIKEAAE